MGEGGKGAFQGYRQKNSMKARDIIKRAGSTFNWGGVAGGVAKETSGEEASGL